MDMEKRTRVMGRSIALGHCVCDPRKPCPCPEFLARDVCECAGERSLPAESVDGPVRLTAHVKSPGCASKVSKVDLKRILAGLPGTDDPRVLVGSDAGDDAGVMVLRELPGQAMILTVDVFAPSVDDPYEFGQIAAANSLSDIYAMGGEPWAALSVIGFPLGKLPEAAMRDILRGGLDKMAEAGVPVVGGHSINDTEVKCGFAVVGMCPKNRFVRNAGAKVGDAVVLTKPLGIGILSFAAQLGLASEPALKRAAESMKTLNKEASRLMLEFGAHAATDVTGYSLLGHAVEVVVNSSVHIEIDFDAIPVFDGVAEFARRGVVPGAVERNREAVPPGMVDLSELRDAQQSILFCPETSGGLLVFLPSGKAKSFVAALGNGGLDASIIGTVVEKRKGGLLTVKSAKSEKYSSLKAPKRPSAVTKAAETKPAAGGASCCAGAAAVVEEATSGSSRRPQPSSLSAFQSYMSFVMAPGAIDLKNKKLMALALSVATRCGPCIKINMEGAREAGATEAELSEAAALGAAFGGGPAMMFYNTLSMNG